MTVSATPNKLILYPGNSQAIQLSGLQDAVTLDFLNSASLTGTLYDDQGNPVSGCSNISFSYVSGSNGDYIANFGDNTFQPLVGTGYTLVVDGAEAGSAIELTLAVEVRIRQR